MNIISRNSNISNENSFVSGRLNTLYFQRQNFLQNPCVREPTTENNDMCDISDQESISNVSLLQNCRNVAFEVNTLNKFGDSARTTRCELIDFVVSNIIILSYNYKENSLRVFLKFYTAGLQYFLHQHAVYFIFSYRGIIS